MQTSTGEVQTYEKFGRFKFEVDGDAAELTIYAGEHGYFLPFADALAGLLVLRGLGHAHDLPVGNYIIRVDALGPDGSSVVARAAVPFEREPGQAVAAVAPAPASAKGFT